MCQLRTMSCCDFNGQDNLPTSVYKVRRIYTTTRSPPSHTHPNTFKIIHVPLNQSIACKSMLKSAHVPRKYNGTKQVLNSFSIRLFAVSSLQHYNFNIGCINCQSLYSGPNKNYIPPVKKQLYKKLIKKNIYKRY